MLTEEKSTEISPSLLRFGVSSFFTNNLFFERTFSNKPLRISPKEHVHLIFAKMKVHLDMYPSKGLNLGGPIMRLLAVLSSAAALSAGIAARPTARRRNTRGSSALGAGLKPGEAQLGLGVAGIAAVAANRVLLVGELPLGVQSRADLIAVAALCGLALEGLAARDVVTRQAEMVSLVGVKGRGVSRSLSGASLTGVLWAARTLLESKETIRSVFVWRKGSTLLREGVLGATDAVDAAAPTFADALRDPKETYLPDLQSLPARVDLAYLPRNAQAALIVPFPDGALVLACDRKRALSPRDIAWISAVVKRLGGILQDSES